MYIERKPIVLYYIEEKISPDRDRFPTRNVISDVNVWQFIRQTQQ